MKKLLFWLLMPIVVIAAIPLTIFSLMHTSDVEDSIPTHLYYEDANGVGLLYEELDTALADIETDADADLVFNLHQDVINTMIFNRVRGDEENEGINPDYMPGDNCQTSGCRMINETVVDLGGENLYVRILGVWVDFETDDEDGKFTLNTALEVQRGEGFVFKTVVQSRFIFDDREASYYLAFDRFRVGNLPVSKGLFSGILGILENTGALDRDAIESGFPAGELDLDDFSYSVRKNDISDFLRENGEDVMISLLAEIIDVIFENRLILFAVENQQIRVTYAISLMRNHNDTDIPEYLYELHDEDGNYDPDAFDSNAHMQRQFESYLMNRALTGESAFKLREPTFNKIIYDSFEGFQEARITQVYGSNDEEKEMSVGLDALWFEFYDDSIEIKALFTIDFVKSLLEFELIRVSEPDAEILEYAPNRIRIGYEDGDTDGSYFLIDEETDADRLQAFKDFLADLEDLDFGRFNDAGHLELDKDQMSDFMDDGTVENAIVVEDIEIVAGGILIEVRAGNEDLEAVLAQFTDSLKQAFNDPALSSTLRDRLNDDSIADDVDAIYNSLEDDGEITDEEMQTLLESYNNLSSEDQGYIHGHVRRICR